MSEIVVAVMACFMVLGAADKAIFSGRFGYGEEFEKGLGAMGPLSMSMVGIMCAAPSIGAFLGSPSRSRRRMRPRCFRGSVSGGRLAAS